MAGLVKDRATQPSVDSGKLHILGVTSTARSRDYPAVPTLAESGVKDYDVSVWFAAFGPRHMPPDVVARLNQAIVRTLADPEVVKRVETLGATVTAGSPDKL